MKTTTKNDVEKNATGGDKKPGPIGIAYSPREGNDPAWVELGPVWKNADGSLAITLRSEPLHWRSPLERRIVIRFKGEQS